MRSALLFSLLLVTASCNQAGSIPTATLDMTAGADLAMCKPDPSFASDCGKPCDRGNSLGVGKFCKYQSDCQDAKSAFLCARIGNPAEFFCTLTCKDNGPADQCGENARCACQGQQCGCYPIACDSPSDGGQID